MNPDSTLTTLSERERYERFDVLQTRMPDVWDSMRKDLDRESVVVVPSVTLDSIDDRGGALAQAYEERFLFLLLLLRQTRLRMIYLTSLPIAPAIVEYYLALLPGVIPSHARARLTLLAVGDGGSRSLSEKVLARPRLLQRVSAAIPDRSRCHLVPYSTTPLERDIAVSLGVPMYGADPRLFGFGTKSGCRQLFREEEITHPLGAEGLASVGDLVDAVLRMRADRPDLREVIVKLNEGVSGGGNALLDLRDLPPPGTPDERAAAEAALPGLAFELPTTRLDNYLAKLAERGGVVEERIVGEELRSPSVQLRVTPSGEVELLSTHDQLLGGPSGQSYLGCVFPADLAYAATIAEAATVIGARLAREGVLGRFAIDFVVVRGASGGWDAFAIEINLRKGGTTHPFLTLQFLVGGSYEPESGRFLSATGDPKYLVATDHLELPQLRGMVLEDLFDVVARHGLHFDQSSQEGVVLHMMSCLTEHGRIGLTAVGNTAERAAELYRRAEDILRREGDASLADVPVAPD